MMDRGSRGLCKCGAHAWGIAGPWHVALVSPVDAGLLEKPLGYLRSRAHKSAYITIRLAPGKKSYLHRIIKNAPPEKDVDHKNQNGMDNRRHNLRFCSQQQNAGNRGRVRTSPWPYKGVRFHHNKWQAQIGINYKFVHLGSFETALEAAQAYDEAAKKHYGKFAKLNLEDVN